MFHNNFSSTFWIFFFWVFSVVKKIPNSIELFYKFSCYQKKNLLKKSASESALEFEHLNQRFFFVFSELE